MDGGDGAEQWRLWCSGGVSYGGAAMVVVAARLCGRGGGTVTGSVAVGSWQRRDHGR
jgi:hypothetical protein